LLGPTFVDKKLMALRPINPLQMTH